MGIQGRLCIVVYAVSFRVKRRYNKLNKNIIYYLKKNIVVTENQIPKPVRISFPAEYLLLQNLVN